MKYENICTEPVMLLINGIHRFSLTNFFFFCGVQEAAKFAEIQKLGLTDVKEIALKTADLPKENKKKTRTVIFTQGADNVIVAKGTRSRALPPLCY